MTFRNARASWLAGALVLLLGWGGCSSDGGGQGRLDAGADAVAGDGATGDGATSVDSGRSDGSAGDAQLPCPTDFDWPVTKQPVTITPSDAWKNRIDLDSDPFIHNVNDQQVRWVKFTILLEDPTKVYFQNGNAELYHHEFATQHLDPFVGMTREQFEAVSLREQGQRAVVGAVVLPPPPIGGGEPPPEVGIQFERREAYHVLMVAELFELVRSSLDSAAAFSAYYFPTFDQEPSARQYAHCLAAEGIELGSADRWIAGDSCYVRGWAIGTLKRFDGAEIDQAYGDGRLGPADILLTGRVPAEVPHLAGIVALEPSTPNSHVAILAQTLGIPFVRLRDSSRATALIDKEVVLRARGGFTCDVDLVDVDGKLDSATRTRLLELAAPPTVTITPKATKGQLALSTDDLHPADIRYVGGKAANFGMLRRAIPDSSPPAIAITFDLWDGFMQQQYSGGRTLKQEIDSRLQGFGFPPQDVAQLKQTLSAIRTLIKNDTVFSEADKSAVIAALAPFDAERRIRFRSSTNVEDAAQFTGAGLYNSVSGCLADETDADELGPSACDASKPDERGVFRAIRKVFASFYNDNAFIERLRLGVDEGQAGMALLVHHSFPDEIELANGVATLHKTGETSFRVDLVTQKGAVSVANPEGGAQPEQVNASKYGFSEEVFHYLIQPSSLVPLGTRVLPESDYPALVNLLIEVATEQFELEFPALTTYTLDFEYKRVEPGTLVVKQVRQVPALSNEKTITPVLLGATHQLCTYQGEQMDVYHMHRTKAIWSLTPKSVELTAAARQQTILAEGAAEYWAAGGTETISGAPASWPGFAHAVVDGEPPDNSSKLTDSFAAGSGPGARTLRLIAEVPQLVSEIDTPILLVDDIFYTFSTTYTTPVTYWGYPGQVSTRDEESTRLSRCTHDQPVGTGWTLQQRTLSGPQGIVVRISFYWPSPPRGISAGYTAPLMKWEKTEIEGLASQTITLTDYFSQTYRPGHHNFSESFIFEPRLEPGIDAGLLAELQGDDIAAIEVEGDPYSGNGTVRIIGLDGDIRQLE